MTSLAITSSTSSLSYVRVLPLPYAEDDIVAQEERRCFEKKYCYVGVSLVHNFVLCV